MTGLRTALLRHAIAPLATIVLGACDAIAPPAQRFAPIGDFVTSDPRHLAERGHAKAVTRPPGLAWSLALEGFGGADDDAPLGQPTWFELRVTLIDHSATTIPRAAPILDGGPAIGGPELVDDSGRHYPCGRARVPEFDDAPSRRGRDATPPATADYAMIFDLPTDYRFRQIAHVTVHWRLRFADGRSLPISSRFRVTGP